MKTTILMTILLLAILIVIAPVKSQSIRTIQADTIFKGYESGETSSVKFINHGTNIVYNHDDKLYEINALTNNPIREIKLEGSKPVTKFSVDENCKYIIYNTDSTNRTFIADYNTGKTIKVLMETYYLGDKFIYTTNCAKCPVVSIIKYNLSNLTPNDTFLFKLESCPGFVPEFKNITSIPNSENIIVSIGGIYSERDYYDVKYNYYIVDFSTDSIRFIDLYQSMNSAGSAYSYLLISEDLKYNILEKSQYITSEDENRIPSTKYIDTDFFIHDSNYKYINDIKESEFKKLFNDPDLKFYFNGIIVENRFLAFGISRKIQKKSKNQIMIYDLKNNIPYALIDFDVNSFSYDNKFIFSNYHGCLATLEFDQVPVLDTKATSENYSVNYSDNNLLISSSLNGKADIRIMNSTGNSIENQKDVSLVEGYNTIQLKNQLLNGLYFCTLCTPNSTVSRKFMVIK